MMPTVVSARSPNARSRWPGRGRVTGGVILIALGLIAVPLTGPVLNYCDAREFGNWCAAVLLIPMIGVALILVGNRTLLRGRRERGWSRQTALPSTPAVLYLRSFGDDATAGKGISAWGPSWLTIAPFTEEEQLVEVLNELGPVTAIGRPGEPLPPLGAQRMYIPNTAWADSVSALMATARLVVLRAGVTAGVSWETEHALRAVPVARFVVLFPRDRRVYDSFDHEVQRILGRTLPPWPIGRHRFRWLNLRYGESSMCLMLRFDPAGQPTLVRLTLDIVPHFRRSYIHPTAGIMRVAFAPVFKSLGASTRPPPISWFLVILVTLAAFVFLIATVMYVTD